jgi:hypothetical protein
MIILSRFSEKRRNNLIIQFNLLKKINTIKNTKKYIINNLNNNPYIIDCLNFLIKQYIVILH